MDLTTAAEAEVEPAGRERAEVTPVTGGTVDRLVDRGRLLLAHRWFWPVALLVGYGAQVLFRLSMVWNLDYPSVHADEDSYLVLARVIAGRPTTEMPVGVVIPGGYPLLISPALWIADRPVLAYHLVMGINALLNALVFLLAYVALRRLGLRRLLAYVFGAVTALLPPVVFYSQFVLSDAVLPTLVLAWLLCMHGWLSEGRTRRGYWYAVGTGATAVYTMATHDRGGVVVAVTGVVLLAALVLRWAPWRTSLAGLGALAVGYGANSVFQGWLERQFTVEPSKVGDLLWEGLLNTEILDRTLGRTAGQVWYFIVSTWGIGGLAVVVCLVAIFHRGFRRPDRIVGGVTVALLVGTALASAAALPDDNRIDNWVYARYVSFLVPAAFVIGVAVIARLRRRVVVYLLGAAVLLDVALAQYVISVAGGDLHSNAKKFVPWGMPDALFLATDWEQLNMMRSTMAAFAVVAAAVLLLLAGGRRVLWAVGVSLALFAVVATTTINQQITIPHSEEREYAGTGFTKLAGVKRGDNVVLAWDLDWGLRMAQSFEVYQGRTWWRDPSWQPVPDEATMVVTPLPKDGGSPESKWSNHPDNWYVKKVIKEHGWVVWRKR
ncbi:hypothetical protein [Kitasatospora sp. NBC_00458]|uniref:hypothetical protein n=1 Tax=Kitasatospora sp. NBC_00458 TaxID=2903568 RepID=UPI002E16DCDC